MLTHIGGITQWCHISRQHCQPFKPQQRQALNLSLQFHYLIKHTGNEKKKMITKVNVS